MRLFTVHGPQKPKQVEPIGEKPESKQHSISLHLPDWLYLLIQAEAHELGQRSISGYITLLLAGLYEQKKEGK